MIRILISHLRCETQRSKFWVAGSAYLPFSSLCRFFRSYFLLSFFRQRNQSRQ